MRNGLIITLLITLIWGVFMYTQGAFPDFMYEPANPDIIPPPQICACVSYSLFSVNNCSVCPLMARPDGVLWFVVLIALPGIIFLSGYTLIRSVIGKMRGR